jgi:hypothetical protein
MYFKKLPCLIILYCHEEIWLPATEYEVSRAYNAISKPLYYARMKPWTSEAHGYLVLSYSPALRPSPASAATGSYRLADPYCKQ